VRLELTVSDVTLTGEIFTVATPTPNPSPQGGGGYESVDAKSPSPLRGGVRGGGSDRVPDLSHFRKLAT
jgi:hypothetical protein